jgi:hypothetical protein
MSPPTGDGMCNTYLESAGVCTELHQYHEGTQRAQQVGHRATFAHVL